MAPPEEFTDTNLAATAVITGAIAAVVIALLAAAAAVITRACHNKIWRNRILRRFRTGVFTDNARLRDHDAAKVNGATELSRRGTQTSSSSTANATFDMTTLD